MTRRQLRESIFKYVFRMEFNTREEMDVQLDYHIGELTDAREKDALYIEEKCRGIVENCAALDEAIEQASEGWKINRIGKAELAILRLAAYEIMFDEDIPNNVAINEAVELAKEFCADEAKAYINAVLAKLVKQ